MNPCKQCEVYKASIETLKAFMLCGAFTKDKKNIWRFEANVTDVMREAVYDALDPEIVSTPASEKVHETSPGSNIYVGGFKFPEKVDSERRKANMMDVETAAAIHRLRNELELAKETQEETQFYRDIETVLDAVEKMKGKE